MRGPFQTRLKQIIAEVVAEFGGMVIEVETMPDHVHLLVELPPQVAVSKLVQILKGRSSRVASTKVVYESGREVRTGVS